jgi:hypothetical protein
MKFHHIAAVATGLAAAGVAVAGCSPSSGTTASSTVTTSPAGSTAAHGSATQAAQPASPASSQQAQAAVGTCQAAQLSYTLGVLTGTSQRTQVVDLSNKGSSACTLAGFPGVDLHGAANGQQDFTWSLVRQSAPYSAVTLEPGQTGHFSLIYLPGTSDSTDITVSKLVITPPNAYTQAELTWNQSVLLQDGATHPGTYITPVVAGS